VNYKKTVLIWIAGFSISLIIFCGMCFAFHNSMEPNIYSPEVDRSIPAPGLFHRHRSEGWGKTLYGKYGIYGIKDILKKKEDKILVWGDSYVEALEVDDKNKMTLKFNEIWKNRNKSGLICAGIGAAGTNLADYVYYAPKYEKLIPGVKGHVVVLHSDMVRLNEAMSGAELRFTPDKIKLIYESPAKKTSGLKESGIAFLRFFGMDFVWWVYTDIKNYRWRFSLGKHVIKDDVVFRHFKKPWKIPEADWNYNAYEFLIKKFRKSTDKEIIFIYVPHVPYIFNEKIYLQDRSSDFIKKLTKLCSENNIVFINMEDAFKKYYNETGKSPRGFPNSRPFLGHLNFSGHKLVAEKLIEHFEKAN